MANNTMQQQKIEQILGLLEREPGLKHTQIDKKLGWAFNTTYNLLYAKAMRGLLYEENDGGLYIAFEQPQS